MNHSGQTGESSYSANTDYGNILIQMNELFPREILSELFPKSKIGKAVGVSDNNTLYKDVTKLSVDTVNHDPKHWSFFQKMAQNVSFQKHSEIPKSVVEDQNANIVGSYFESSMQTFDRSSIQVIRNKDIIEEVKLGSGTYGEIYRGQWKVSNVVIKQIKKSCFTSLEPSDLQILTNKFWREVGILSKLKHPNVVQTFGVVIDSPGGQLKLITEYVVHSCLRSVFVKNDRVLDKRQKLIIARDAAMALEYLHINKIVHLNFKLTNLLVDLNDPLEPKGKVGDLGIFNYQMKMNPLDEVGDHLKGTLPWTAPELLNGNGRISEKVDIFSFGIVLWEILTGKIPYADMDTITMLDGVMNNNLRPSIPSGCDSHYRNLMEECWAPDPNARPSFTEIANRLRIMADAKFPTY